MKKITTWYQEIKRKWKAETPKIAKRIRNTAAILSAVIPGAWLTFQTMGITLPVFVSNYIGVITLLSLIITGVAGMKEKKEKDSK